MSLALQADSLPAKPSTWLKRRWELQYVPTASQTQRDEAAHMGFFPLNPKLLAHRLAHFYSLV